MCKDGSRRAEGFPGKWKYHTFCQLPGTAIWGVEEIRQELRFYIRNIPNMIGQFTALLAKDNVNIDDMTNKSRKAAMHIRVIDVDGTVSDEVAAKIEGVSGVLGVRVIR